ncbi:hypothetical protein [Sporisorium scitamineum]|uniref:Uncharacterized protein n=1 Tax=Sporisorium scitamineum TaxID=49012 RepID=A0A0F7S799_9BASI|nr:hypothetical protein [Sporisorium scitamineum]
MKLPARSLIKKLVRAHLPPNTRLSKTADLYVMLAFLIYLQRLANESKVVHQIDLSNGLKGSRSITRRHINGAHKHVTLTQMAGAAARSVPINRTFALIAKKCRAYTWALKSSARVKHDHRDSQSTKDLIQSPNSLYASRLPASSSLASGQSLSWDQRSTHNHNNTRTRTLTEQTFASC